MGFKFLTVSPNKPFQNYFNWYVRWRCSLLAISLWEWSNQKKLSSWKASISPVVWEQQREKVCTHFMCKKCGTPFFIHKNCFLIDSWNTYLLWHTFVLVKDVSWQQNLFKIYNEKKYILHKFWFVRTYQSAKFWIFLPFVNIGNNVCVHVSSTDYRKKSQHKDSQ
jgi:hypothetical protein